MIGSIGIGDIGVIGIIRVIGVIGAEGGWQGEWLAGKRAVGKAAGGRLLF